MHCVDRARPGHRKTNPEEGNGNNRKPNDTQLVASTNSNPRWNPLSTTSTAELVTRVNDICETDKHEFLILTLHFLNDGNFLNMYLVFCHFGIFTAKQRVNRCSTRTQTLSSQELLPSLPAPVTTSVEVAEGSNQSNNIHIRQSSVFCDTLVESSQNQTPQTHH